METAPSAPSATVTASAANTNTTAEVSVKPESAQPQPAPSIGDMFKSPLFLLLIGIWILFLFSSRKQKKKVQERKDQLAALKKGDKVVTIGRIHGEIVGMDEKTLTLKIDAKGATITVDRDAILGLRGEAGTADAVGSANNA